MAEYVKGLIGIPGLRFRPAVKDQPPGIEADVASLAGQRSGAAWACERRYGNGRVRMTIPIGDRGCLSSLFLTPCHYCDCRGSAAPPVLGFSTARFFTAVASGCWLSSAGHFMLLRLRKASSSVNRLFPRTRNLVHLDGIARSGDTSDGNVDEFLRLLHLMTRVRVFEDKPAVIE